MKLRILLEVALLWPLPSWTADSVSAAGHQARALGDHDHQRDERHAAHACRSACENDTRAASQDGGGFGGARSPGPEDDDTGDLLDKVELSKPLSFGDDDKSCQRTIISLSRSKQEGHLECSNETMKRSGDVHIEAINPENVKGSMQMTAAGGGRTMNVNVGFTAKWIGTSCAE